MCSYRQGTLAPVEERLKIWETASLEKVSLPVGSLIIVFTLISFVGRGFGRSWANCFPFFSRCGNQLLAILFHINHSVYS